jgi:TRAP transporter TAXI family solute receptor
MKGARKMKKSRNAKYWLLAVVSSVLLALVGSVNVCLGAEATRLVMVGSSSGGTAHLFLAALAPILNKYIPGMEASASTGGTAENVPLLERGEIKVAAISTGTGIKLYGTEWLKKTRLRTLFAMFHAPYNLLVPKDSPIKKFSDLKGKRVSAGAKGGGEGYLFQRLIDVMGMKESDMRVEYLGKGEGINAYKDGVVDAISLLAPLPSPAILELASHPRGVRIVGLAPQDLQKLIAKYPEYSEYTIEKKWYANVLKDASDILSFTEWYYVATRDDFPENMAYQITKVLDEHHDELVTAFKSANSSTAEATAKYPGFQLHPGTARYLKEKGFIK